MKDALVFVAAIAGIVVTVAAIGRLWALAMWVRDGRPKFTASEQLHIDRLRAQGRTQTGARREVLRLRRSPYAASVREIRESGALLGSSSDNPR